MEGNAKKSNGHLLGGVTMENLIERYIAAVVQQLPEKERAEVAQELRSNIYDMLSDQPNDAEINNIGKTLVISFLRRCMMSTFAY